MVHISFMVDDYYHYDENTYSLRGEWTGKVFRIGDEVTVRVRSVNMEEYKVDFELVEAKGSTININRWMILEEEKEAGSEGGRYFGNKENCRRSNTESK